MRSRLFITIFTATAASAVALAGFAAPPAAAVVNPLPLSPSGRVAVLSTNMAELFNDPDINETWDTKHWAYRVQNVLASLNASNPIIPNYAPDIVLLSETTQESTNHAVTELTSYTGYTYAVAANAATAFGTLSNAMESQSTTAADVMRETAVIYNTATMTSTSPASTPLTYPSSEVLGTPDDTWVTLRQSTALLRKITGGQYYRAYSVHFRPYPFVNNHEGMTAQWGSYLKWRISQPDMGPAGTKYIIGGDFNRLPCTVSNSGNAGVSCSTVGSTPSGYWTGITAPQSGAPAVFYPARSAAAADTKVDNIFSSMTPLTSTYDYDYKTYNPDPAATTYFASSTDLINCQNNYYDLGLGTSTGARSIKGCYERYYSDHEFLSAVFG